jgi:hypothetical protein
MPYYWLSHHYLLKGDLDAARQLLDQGLQVCNRKRLLCHEYGEVEHEAGKIFEAVKWWTRGAVLEITSEAYHSYSCFMYLGYVAGWCALPNESKLLFRVTDAIESIRLSDTGQQKLYSMVRNADTAVLASVVTLLVATYRKQLSAVTDGR